MVSLIPNYLERKAKKLSNKKKTTDNNLGKFMPVFFVSSVVLAYFVGNLSHRLQMVKGNEVKTAGLQATSPQAAKLQAEIDKVLLPDKYNLGISFGDVIIKMVQMGAIDKDKFISLYAERSPLTESQKNLLESASNEKIILNSENAQLILNLLWPLGVSNQTKVLSEGPMGASEYKDKIGNFASTGGWTLGKVDGGKLFNSLSIINLTPAQERIVKEIADNVYRPCCGNSTAFPDCNHGAAMLGFIELAVSQGMSKDDIYKKALVLNSYWFPQNYSEIAMYFKTQKNTDWLKVDPRIVLGSEYSSSQGYAIIDKKLQDEGSLPKVKSGGGGCGV